MLTSSYTVTPTTLPQAHRPTNARDSGASRALEADACGESGGQQKMSRSMNIFEYTVRICNIFNIYSRIEVCSIIADRNINTVNSPICAPKLALPATCQYHSTSCLVMFS